MKSWILITSGLLLCIGCSKDNVNPPSALTPEQKQIQTHMLDLQENSYNLFEQYIQQIDSSSAIDSLVKVIIEDPEVDSAEAGTQGILIKYKSGLWGGLFIESEMHPEIEDVDLNSDTEFSVQKARTCISAGSEDIVVPPNKNVRILCSVYDEFYSLNSGLFDKLQEYFPKTGFEVVQFDKDEEVTVNKLKNLGDAGIIILNTHGWAIPSSKTIQNVYIMTGEEVNEQTSADYWDEMKKKWIIEGTTKQGHRYFVNEDFMVEYDKFKDDTTLIFGAFCYSDRGSWSDNMVDLCRAGGYFGYNWSVLAVASTNWTNNLFYHLSDTSRARPLSCNGWYNSKTIEKYYTKWTSPSMYQTVAINYTHLYDIALWESEDIDYELKLWLQNIDGSFKFTDPWDSVSYFKKEVDLASTDEISGTLYGTTFSAEWEGVTVPITGGTSTGSAYFNFSSDFSAIQTFSLEITRKDGDWTYYYDLTGSNIPSLGSLKRYTLEGTQACGNIVFNHNYTLEDNNGSWINELENYSCSDGAGDMALSFLEFHFKPVK